MIRLPTDLVNIIHKYADEIIYMPKLLPWIESVRPRCMQSDVRHWISQNRNPIIVEYLNNNRCMVKWATVCFNSSAGPLLKDKHAVICKDALLCNTSAEAKEILEVDESEYFNIITAFELSFTPRYYYGILTYHRVLTVCNVHLLEHHWIDWKLICANTSDNAIDLIQNLLKTDTNAESKLGWELLCANENARVIPIIQKYNKINWKYLAGNPYAIDLIDEYFSTGIMNEPLLSKNKCAVQYLKMYPNIIDWNLICYNKSFAAMQLIEEHYAKVYYKICWEKLTDNPFAMKLLEKHQDKLQWRTIWYNPGIFQIDTDRMNAMHAAIDLL